MPTFPKLVAAVAFAALACAASWHLLSQVEFPMQTGWLLPGNAIIWALAGWSLSGARAGRGAVAAIGNGLTTGLVAYLASVLVWALHQVTLHILRRHFSDPTDAIGLLGQKIIEVAAVGARTDILIGLAAGSVAAGLLAEIFARKRRP